MSAPMGPPPSMNPAAAPPSFPKMDMGETSRPIWPQMRPGKTMQCGRAIFAMALAFAQSAAADARPAGHQKTPATVVGRFYGNWTEADALPTSLRISRRGQLYVVDLQTMAPHNR